MLSRSTFWYIGSEIPHGFQDYQSGGSQCWQIQYGSFHVFCVLYLCFSLQGDFDGHTNMEQTPSTPSGLLLSHFKDVITRGEGRVYQSSVRKIHCTFSRSEWPAFNTGCLAEVSFDLGLVQGNNNVISKPKFHHPNQIPYVVVW